MDRIPLDGSKFARIYLRDWSGTFAPGSVLIYDTSKKGTGVPGLYAFKVDGDIVVRRVIPTAEGAQLSCSNPNYPPLPLTGAMAVCGRVVAQISRV